MLLKRFVVAGVNWAPDTEDAYEHVSNILVNVTRFKEGRVLMLQPGRGILQASRFWWLAISTECVTEAFNSRVLYILILMQQCANHVRTLPLAAIQLLLLAGTRGAVESPIEFKTAGCSWSHSELLHVL